MASFQQYNVSPWLTAVRVVSASNVSGTYNNGPLNNGVGATLTIAASSLTVDSVVCAVGDRVLLSAQTNANENGIYVVNSIGSTVVLQRSADMQSIEQIKPGFYVTVGAGTNFAGDALSVIEPLPAAFGVNNLVVAQPAVSAAAPFVVLGNITAGSTAVAGKLGSLSGAAAAGELFLAAVTNSAGNFNTTISNASSVGQSQVISVPDSGATTANFILSKTTGTQHVTVGSLQVDAGNVSAGLAAGGTAGTFVSYSATGSKGSLILAAVANTGNTNTTISNAAMGQASVISIPDPGAATANFVLDAGTATAVTVTTANITNLKYGATPVAQVDPASCTISAAAGAVNTATVTIQLKDGSGTNMARSVRFKVYSSSAADGLTLQSAASTGYSVASGGLSLANGTAVTTQIECMSSATGGCVLSLLDTGKQTSYLVLVLPTGNKISAQLSADSYG